MTNERKHTTEAWNALNNECLPSRGRNLDYWWQLTGFHLANMVEGAGYSVQKQYQALLFHYHCVVPFLGPAPGDDGSVKWKSLMGVDGSPMEYSWKWNTRPEGQPEIRYTMETIGEKAGTTSDPLNQQPGLEFMHQIPKIVPSADFTWCHHFLAHLFDHDISKYNKETEEGVQPIGTLGHGVEYGPKGLAIKSYVSSRRLGCRGHATLEQWNEAIKLLNPDNKNLDALARFIDTSPRGKQLTPFLLALDDVAPSKARLKFYFMSPHTSFVSVREMISLGGIIPIAESRLQELRSLIVAVIGIPEDYPEDIDIPSKPWTPPAQEIFAEQPALLGGYVYYFDVAPGRSNTISNVKFYIPVRQYGPDDATIARNLVEWMKGRDRGGYADGFLRTLESLAEHRELSQGKGLQTYIGCIFKGNGELEITSYFGPELYHAGRFTSGNGVTNGMH